MVVVYHRNWSMKMNFKFKFKSVLLFLKVCVKYIYIYIASRPNGSAVRKREERSSSKSLVIIVSLLLRLGFQAVLIFSAFPADFFIFRGFLRFFTFLFSLILLPFQVHLGQWLSVPWHLHQLVRGEV